MNHHTISGVTAGNGRGARRALSLFLLIPLILSGCGKSGNSVSVSSSSAKEESDIEIGFVLKEKKAEFWKLLAAGAESEGKKKKVTVTIQGTDDDSDAQTQVKEVRSLIKRKVDVICVAPISDEMLLPCLKDAVDAGIRVIAVDSDTSLEDKISYIGTDNYNAAYEGAKYAADAVGDSGSAVVLRGYLGDKTHDARTSGITDCLVEKGMIVEKSVESSADTVKEDTSELLSEFPDLKLIMTTHDKLTPGVLDALEELGRTDVRVFGFDGKIEVAEEIPENGQLIGTTAQEPYRMGQLAVDTAVSALNGKSVEKTIYSGHTVVNSENVEEYLSEVETLVKSMDGQEETSSSS